MKNFLPLFLLFGFTVLVSSCSKEEEILIEPPVISTPTTTEDEGSWELTYDPSDISTEQEFFDDEGVSDSDQVNENEVLDAPTMNTTVDIDVDRTPLSVKNSSNNTEGETTTIKTFSRSE